MTGPLPLSPMARALSRPRNMAPAAPMMAGDQAPGMIPSIGGETMNADPRGAGNDQRSFGSFSEMMNDPDFQGDWGKVAAMSGPMALGAGALSAMSGVGGLGGMIEGSSPSLPGLGPQEMAAAQASSANNPGAELGIEGGAGPGIDMASLGGPEPSSPGMFAAGGVVRRSDLGGPNPPGPDEGFAALTPGEVVVNQSQQQRMGPQARQAMMRALHGGRR